MLNDCGKELLKPWVSVQNVVLVGSMIFIIALFRLSSSELASWVQAVGSIMAIWGALRVSQVQQKNAQRLKVSELIAMAEGLALLVREAGQQCSLFAIAAKNPHPLMFKLNFLGRNKELFRITLSCMEAVSVRDLGSPVLVAMHLEMSAAMSEMYKTMQELQTVDQGDVDKIAFLYIQLQTNSGWFQSMLEGFEKAHKNKIESLSAFS